MTGTGTAIRAAARLVLVALFLAPIPASAVAPIRPRLVVVVSVDQLGRELVDRYLPLFPPGGFRRFLDAGADYPSCQHGHFLTLTGPGHAVMLTGAYPMRTGIVANRWYSRRENKMVGCVEDERFPMLDRRGPAPAAGSSPLRLRTSTVGDVLRASTAGRAKVVSIALKDRAAVLLGGLRPNGAYWMDEGSCRFTTSSYYMPALPPWVERFNADKGCAAGLGGTWVKLRTDLDYEQLADVDDAPYEQDAYGLGRVFPHPLTEQKEADSRYAAVLCSPLGNEVLLRLAKAAIEFESLGGDDVPDLLAVGFSSNDYVGHVFGPHSQEVLDMTLRVDRLLAELMDELDRSVGKGQWTIALTSDHGVAPIPEYLEKKGILPPRDDHYRWATKRVRSEVERKLSERFFAGHAAPADFPGFFAAWDDATSPFVWINRSAIERLPGAPPLDQVLLAMRTEIENLDGVARVYTAGEREMLSASRDPFDLRVYRTWERRDGGDLLIQLEPYWFPGFGSATTHGTAYAYDTHVPLMLYGASIHAGRYARPVSVADLASTLSALLGIQPPPADQGEPLVEALSTN